LEIKGRPKLAISPGTPKIDAGHFTTMGVLLLAEGQYRIGPQLTGKIVSVSSGVEPVVFHDWIDGSGGTSGL
jgi:hypothetical protein